MKSTKPHWIAIGVLSIALVGIILKFMVLGSTETAADGRTAVILEPAQRLTVLKEMRVLLEATQGVVEALAEDDLVAAEKAARAVGASAIATVDFKLASKLPIEFKQLGFGTHHAFDDIADLAVKKEPVKVIQRKLAETMNNCVACHSSYQLPMMAVK